MTDKPKTNNATDAGPSRWVTTEVTAQVTAHGQALADASQWPARRAEIAHTLQAELYGFVPAPLPTRGELLHAAVARPFGNARLSSWRIHAGDGIGFTMQLLQPAGVVQAPVIVTGDACWRYATDEVVRAVLGAGMALAQFNRVDIAADTDAGTRSGRIFEVLGDQTFGAIAAWAWGYQRCVDVLQTVPGVRADNIAVVGHSRGGKAALLAGALDERIALTSANNSGAAGAGSHCWLGQGAETLVDLVQAFPHWCVPGLGARLAQGWQPSWDQHALKALVAPRALLTTEGEADLWANPWGTWHTHRAAQAVYRALGVPQHISVAYRTGGHAHSLQDWQTLITCAQAVFAGQACPSQPLPRFLQEHDAPLHGELP